MHRVLIAGCGYVGRQVARLFADAGSEVTAVVRSEASAFRLSDQPFQTRTCDISNPAETLEKLGDLKESDLIIHCASSSRGGAEEYRKVYLEGARNLLALRPLKFIFTSSTSVYAQTDGNWVTEESPAEPDRETGRILRETEDMVLGRAGGIVARLAGIYGPGRSLLVKKVLDNTAIIEGHGQRFLNFIHRDDAAAALVFLGNSISPISQSGIFNVSDVTPLSQIDCYRQIADFFHKPLPPSGPADSERKRGVTNKKVDNAKLRALGWRPRFSSLLQALHEDKLLLADLPDAPQ